MGPLAEGHRHRDHGRADAARLDAGAVSGRRPGARAARAGGWPRTGGRAADPSPGACGSTPTACCATPRTLRLPAAEAAAARRGRRPPQASSEPSSAGRRRRLVRRGPADDSRRTSARWRDSRSASRRSRSRSRSRSWASPGDAPLRERPAARAGRRPAVRGVAGRPSSWSRAVLNLTHPRVTRHPGGSCPAGSSRRRSRSTPLGTLPAREPHAPRGLADLLAVGVALAGARDAHALRRRELSSSRCGRSARRRGPPALGPPGRPRGPRREDHRRPSRRPGDPPDLAADDVTWTFRYVDGGNVVLPNGWESEEVDPGELRPARRRPAVCKGGRSRPSRSSCAAPKAGFTS